MQWLSYAWQPVIKADVNVRPRKDFCEQPPLPVSSSSVRVSKRALDTKTRDKGQWSSIAASTAPPPPHQGYRYANQHGRENATDYMGRFRHPIRILAVSIGPNGRPPPSPPAFASNPATSEQIPTEVSEDLPESQPQRRDVKECAMDRGPQ